MKVFIAILLFVAIVEHVESKPGGKMLQCYFGAWSDIGGPVTGYEYLPMKKEESCLGANDACLTQTVVGRVKGGIKKRKKFMAMGDNGIRTINLGQCIDRELCKDDLCQYAKRDFPEIVVTSCSVTCCYGNLCNTNEQQYQVNDHDMAMKKNAN